MFFLYDFQHFFLLTSFKKKDKYCIHTLSLSPIANMVYYTEFVLYVNVCTYNKFICTYLICTTCNVYTATYFLAEY